MYFILINRMHRFSKHYRVHLFALIIVNMDLGIIVKTAMV